MHDRSLDGVLMPVDKPIVYAYARAGEKSGLYVTYDNKRSAAAITRCLIEKGHRRIAVIAGHRDSDPSRQRLNGFLEAMEEAGLAVPPEYIRWGDWESPAAAAQTEALLSLDLAPTAIFAMNDLMAAGCYLAIRRRGLDIPQDVSVAGFDNREISANLHPPLTTVSLPTREIGYESARMLLDLLEEPKAGHESLVLACSLCIRDSVGNP
jgi:LacI family transcriptional regulator